MTTWHDGERPDDVAFFFVSSTSVDDVDVRNYLVIHVGSSKARAQYALTAD
jgi:hypothetical protein